MLVDILQVSLIQLVRVPPSNQQLPPQLPVIASVKHSPSPFPHSQWRVSWSLWYWRIYLELVMLLSFFYSSIHLFHKHLFCDIHKMSGTCWVLEIWTWTRYDLEKDTDSHGVITPSTVDNLLCKQWHRGLKEQVWETWLCTSYPFLLLFLVKVERSTSHVRILSLKRQSSISIHLSNTQIINPLKRKTRLLFNNYLWKKNPYNF